jgi:hypothetical protein
MVKLPFSQLAWSQSSVSSRLVSAVNSEKVYGITSFGSGETSGFKQEVIMKKVAGEKVWLKRGQ